MKTKYNNFPLECRIFLDLETGNVDFEHLIEEKGRYWVAINLVFQTFFSLTYLIALLLLPILIFFPIMIFIEGEYLLFTGICFGIFIFIYSPIIISYPFTYLPDFSKWFPKIGAIVGRLAGEPIKANIISDNVIDNKFIIPHFNNCFLNYKCYGDFNKYIKSIEIKENYIEKIIEKKKMKWRCTNWEAIFVFKQKPITGFMQIEYK